MVDDGSIYRTAEMVRKIAKRRSGVRLISYHQNRGKGFAVKRGFDEATGDVLMILDADMSVPPEELKRFFEIISKGKADFVNGTRMIYQMEDQAMRNLHIFGNRIFGKIFSWLLGQRVTDTLCGTKALLKKDYKKIEMGKCRWGDFDLLFGAARLRLRMAEIPVHYRKRVAGESKMKTFRHGFFLLRMCFRGFWKLKVKGFFRTNA